MQWNFCQIVLPNQVSPSKHVQKLITECVHLKYHNKLTHKKLKCPIGLYCIAQEFLEGSDWYLWRGDVYDCILVMLLKMVDKFNSDRYSVLLAIGVPSMH